MAHYDMNRMMTTREMIFALIALPFKKLASTFSLRGYRTARLMWLDQLNATSDAELAKRGLSRAEATQVMLRSQF